MRRVLDLVQMTGYADRPASRLSGGQQQRIAVARAIAFSPTVLLFDEPLSNLDAKLRAEMRVELRELQRRLDITSVYVTHDQEEALAISDRVIVMNHGRIEQIGSPETIYNRPKSLFVADFVGAANLIQGQVSQAATATLFETVGGLRAEGTPDGRAGGETTLALRSAYIMLQRDRPADPDANIRHGHNPPADVPWRFHPVRRRLAGRAVDRPPPADRNDRGRRGGHDHLRSGALHPALEVAARTHVEFRSKEVPMSGFFYYLLTFAESVTSVFGIAVCL